MLSVKQGGIKYHFLSLWNDLTWDWISVSQATGKQSNHYLNGTVNIYIYIYICCIFTLDRAVNQRCTCVDKPKKKRKQVGVMKEYRQMLVAVETVEDRKAWVMASLQAEGCGPQWPLAEQTQPRCGRSAKWVLEDNTACYGREKKLSQYSSLSLSPLMSHTPQKHQPFPE